MMHVRALSGGGEGGETQNIFQSEDMEDTKNPEIIMTKTNITWKIGLHQIILHHLKTRKTKNV